MTLKRTKIRKLYIAQETTFGVDPSANGSGYSYVHAIEASIPSLGRGIIPGNYQDASLDPAADEVAEQRASMAFKLPPRASGTPGTSGAAIACEADLLLQSFLGTVTRGTGSAVGGGNASTTNILVASSAGFTKYMAVWCTETSEMRFVTAVPDGTHVTLHAALSSAPTTGNIVASCLHTPANSGHKSLAVCFELDAVQYTMLGGKCDSAKVGGLAANGRPLLELGFSFDSYSATAKGSLPTAADAFSAVKAPILKGCPFWIDTTQTPLAGADLDFGVKFDFSDDQGATNGRGGIEAVARDVKGAIEPWWNAQNLTDFQAGTTHALGLAVGNQNTGWGFYVPVAQFLSHEPQDKAGLLAQKLAWGAKLNGSNAAFALSVF